MTAVMMRLRRPSLTALVLSSLVRATGPPRSVRRQLFLRQAETPLATGEEIKRTFQLGHIEIRPQHLTEEQLGIRRMPKQEIADPLFPTGADHQIDLRHAGELHVRGEAGFIDLGRTYRSTGALARKFLSSLNYIPPAAITHGDLQLQAVIASRPLLRRGNPRLQPDGQLLAVADEAHPHAVRMQLVDFAVERVHEQIHETRDLVGGPVPVFAREGKQGQRFDATPRAFLDRHARGLQARAMTGGARDALGFRPASVAVHDDRYMPRKGGQTCMTSFSLAVSNCSMSAMCLSVSFWTSVSALRSSSCEMSFSFKRSLMSLITSRRTLRTATRAPSAS